jgi:hypothetical protein
MESLEPKRHRCRSACSRADCGRSAEGAVGLFDDGEKPTIRGPGENKYVTYDASAAEKKLGL